MERMSIQIDYVTSPDEGGYDQAPEGLDEFRDDLDINYVSLVRGHPGVRGGGWYQFAIQIISNFSLQDIVNLIIGGVAYDLLKSGTSSLLLRPLLRAYEKLKIRNTKINFGIDEITLHLQDVDIIIRKTGAQPLNTDLKILLNALTENFEQLKYKSIELPYVIHIPVFEDPMHKFCYYRSMLDVDETIQGISSSDYLKFWGVRYNRHGRICVFDVRKHSIIDAQYMTQTEYWTAWQKAWEKEHALEEHKRTE